MISQSNEFFINMKSIPDKKSSEYKAFWDIEIKKLKEGLTIGGYWIHPWLYWHVNFWNIQLFTENSLGKTVRQQGIAQLRDTEFLIAEHLYKAEKEKKGLAIVGSRRLGKSEFSSSYSGMNATLYQGTENLITGGNESDIKLITDKIDLGLRNLPNRLKIIDRIDNNWKKQVTLGYKDKVTSERNEWSKILIRNFDDGKNTEAVAGTTAFSFILDEFCKFPFLRCFEAAIPAFASPFGWACVPILTATGGNMDKATDGRKLCENPEAYNFIVTNIPEENNKKFVLFIPGTMSVDVPREEKTLEEFLDIKEIPHEKGVGLEKIPIHVADIEEGKRIIAEKREQASHSSDTSALLKSRMYFPLTTEDVFLSESNNKFPIDKINAWQSYLKEHYEPVYIDLFRDLKGAVNWKHSDLKPISVFPVTPKTAREAPISIFEFPIKDSPRFTYIVGIDPVNNNESADREVSLFTITVFKRMISPLDEYKDEIVATYRGRTKDLSEMHEIALMIAEFYNAVGGVIPEASENSIFQYFFMKKKSHFLADSFDLLKTINAKTSFKEGKKGLPANPKYQRHYMHLMIEYANEEIRFLNEEGEEEIRTGVQRIKDYMVLEEMRNYRGKTGTTGGVHDGNFDSIISFGAALTLANFYNYKYPILSIPKRKEEDVKKREPMIKTPFGNLNKEKLNPFSQDNNTKLPRWLRR